MIQPPITTKFLQLDSFEPDQLLEAVQGARLEHYILSGCRCSARLAHWKCGGLSVDQGSYDFPVRILGAMPRQAICVAYLRKVTQSSWVNGLTVDDSTIEYYPPYTELNYRAGPGTEWVVIECEEEALQDVARRELGRDLDLPKHVVSFSDSETCRVELDRMVQLLWSDPLSGTLMIEPLLGGVARVLDARRRASHSVLSSAARKRTVMLEQADAYLRANIENPFDLGGLVSALGVNARTLQREFVGKYGVTPQEWARCLALYKARKRLRTSDGKRLTVEAIAHECGFRHMGRFASYYLELFGERPSETLRAVHAARKS
jgi:AraC-like DNA-binding protein